MVSAKVGKICVIYNALRQDFSTKIAIPAQPIYQTILKIIINTN